MTQPYRFKTISAFHEFRGLPGPEHPLISVFNVEALKYVRQDEPRAIVLDFYMIAVKRNFNGRMKYGQQEYDFDEGIMTFIAPGQSFSIEANRDEALQHQGWMVAIHPDYFWGSPLAQKMKQYEFFGYAVNEALFLSEKEEASIIAIIQNIEQEYRSNTDNYSQDVILAQLELLFTYAERFYNRQFITRKITNHQVLARLEEILNTWFNSNDLVEKGLPTVQYIAGLVNVSPNYLSGLLKVLTGMSTQQHIHEKLIEKAKEKLTTTGLSVSEIAYELGFEHPQSFSKLFKTKTNQSPLDFRQSFN